MAGKKVKKVRAGGATAAPGRKGPGAVMAVVIAVALVAAAWGGWSWSRYSGEEDRFVALVSAGTESLGAVERQRAATGGHLEPG